MWAIFKQFEAWEGTLKSLLWSHTNHKEHIGHVFVYPRGSICELVHMLVG